MCFVFFFKFKFKFLIKKKFEMRNKQDFFLNFYLKALKKKLEYLKERERERFVTK